jgi:hypothetical protein
MKKTFEQLPGWEFDIEEVSAGVYRTTGRDREGRRLSFVGEDPQNLLQQCIAAAMTASTPAVGQSKEKP